VFNADFLRKQVASLGAGSRENAGDNHGEDQIAFVAKMLIDELVEVPSSCKLPRTAAHGHGTGADKVEGWRKR
jgi:hypothetical protein